MSTDITNIALVLEDGSVFEGEAVGYMPENGIAAGEVVFHTALTGYQEVFTDPSYAGQIITFTTSHIGNYGVTPIDSESRGTFARGVIMRDMAQNEHLRESMRLATLIQTGMRTVHPGPSRGVKQAGLVVLVTAFMPAVLVEIGFGTNRAEAAYITNPQRTAELADRLADAVERYLDEYDRRVGG